MVEFIEFVVVLPHPLPGRPGLRERFGPGERVVRPGVARALLEGFGVEPEVVEAVVQGQAVMRLEPEGRVIRGEAFRVRVSLAGEAA